MLFNNAHIQQAARPQNTGQEYNKHKCTIKTTPLGEYSMLSKIGNVNLKITWDDCSATLNDSSWLVRRKQLTLSRQRK